MSLTKPVQMDPKANHQLNLTSKLHQATVVDRIHEIDWDTGSDAPMVVELDPTTACNLACPDCISRDLLNQGFFSRKRLRELTRELVDAGVKAVILIGGGEPLAHPEIGWVIDYLGRHGVQLGITTNGLLIERYLEPIARYASWVRVSMDAGTPETFHRIRPSHSGESQFDNAIRNMRKLAALKTGKLGYSFMIYSEGRFDPADVPNRLTDYPNLIASDDPGFTNVREIYRAASIARDIGCDYFEVKPMYDINHYAIEQQEALINTTIDQVERALALQTNDFRVLQATKLKNVLRGEGNIEPKEYTRCAVSQLRTLITPSGVYVCPYFRGRQDKMIGDVREQSLGQMWHGDTRRGVMEKLDPSVDCRMHCIRHESNLMLEDMITGNNEVEVVDDFDLFI
jgi:MoaA/NifB/PqqE/SkfB family radical SAM enzyme